MIEARWAALDEETWASERVNLEIQKANADAGGDWLVVATDEAEQAEAAARARVAAAMGEG